MVSIDIKASPSDIRDFNMAMNRLMREAGKTPEQAITWGGIKLMDSLEASTKTAPEKRKVYVPKIKKQKLWKNPQGESLFYVQMFRANGAAHRAPVWAMSKADAQNKPIANIENRKLAKRSWGWARHALFNKPLLDAGGLHILKQRVDTVRLKTATMFHVRVKNRLGYIQDAFRRKGKYNVDTAMRRAANGMMHQVEKRLFRKYAK